MKTVLLIHTETQYFGGAEKMLVNFIDGLVACNIDLIVVVGEGGRLTRGLNAAVRTVAIPNNSHFNPISLWRQLKSLVRSLGQQPVVAVHAWAARDWQLAVAFGALRRVPALGTLHDHPAASYIRQRRRLLMRYCANWGMDKIVCVSEAVRRACVEEGYYEAKLAVIHNGIPITPRKIRKKPSTCLQLGWLGSFSEVKGFEGLFEILAQFDKLANSEWEVAIGGEAQHQAEHELKARVAHRFDRSAWWPKVHFKGWIAHPAEFLETLDLLLFTSKLFDSLPNVLLECGAARIPALAAVTGGVSEIVLDQPEKTGWLFEAGNWRQAAECLVKISTDRDGLKRAGERAAERVSEHFSANRMVNEYVGLYKQLQIL